MAFHPSPNFQLSFRTTNRIADSKATEGSIALSQRNDWLPAMQQNWREYARQTKLLQNAVETLFPHRSQEKSLENFLEKLPHRFGEIHEALTKFDRSDENLTPPCEIAKLLEVTNDLSSKIAFQADIARKIIDHSSQMHRLVKELFCVKSMTNSFLKQLVKDIRLDFSHFRNDIAPVLHPAIGYEDFLPTLEWQSEPQVYGQGIQTAFLLLYLVPEFRFRDYEIEEMLISAIMQDIGLLSLEKIYRLSSREIEQSTSEIFEQHPRYSVAMLSGVSNCPVAVLKMVGEHHERENGTGFPKGELSCSFSNSSRLLALTARFVSRSAEETTQNQSMAYRLSNTDFLHTTCEKIRTETLRERFDFELAQKFIEALKLGSAEISSTDKVPHSNAVFDGQYRHAHQAEKLLPQPQLLTALGLSKVKPRFSRPS